MLKVGIIHSSINSQNQMMTDCSSDLLVVCLAVLVVGLVTLTVGCTIGNIREESGTPMPPQICGSSVGHVVDLAVDIVGLGFVVVGLFVVVIVVVVVVDVVVVVVVVVDCGGVVIAVIFFWSSVRIGSPKKLKIP